MSVPPVKLTFVPSPNCTILLPAARLLPACGSTLTLPAVIVKVEPMGKDIAPNMFTVAFAPPTSSDPPAVTVIVLLPPPYAKVPASTCKVPLMVGEPAFVVVPAPLLEIEAAGLSIHSLPVAATIVWLPAYGARVEALESLNVPLVTTRRLARPLGGPMVIGRTTSRRVEGPAPLLVVMA